MGENQIFGRCNFYIERFSRNDADSYARALQQRRIVRAQPGFGLGLLMRLLQQISPERLRCLGVPDLLTVDCALYEKITVYFFDPLQSLLCGKAQDTSTGKAGAVKASLDVLGGDKRPDSVMNNHELFPGIDRADAVAYGILAFLAAGDRKSTRLNSSHYS